MSQKNHRKYYKCILFVCSLVIVQSCSRYVYPNNLAQAYTEIQNLVTAIKLYGKDYGKFPDVPYSEGSLLRNSEALFLLLSHPDKNSVIYMETNLNNSPIIDPFNNYYNVVLGEIGKSIELRDAVINDSIAIWSSGTNGVNEYGSGDDIVSWESYEANKKRIER